jgi:hypothetical protein
MVLDGLREDACMSRPLRADIVDDWHHAMSRGLERRDLFTDDRDCSRCFGLLRGVRSATGMTTTGATWPSGLAGGIAA